MYPEDQGILAQPKKKDIPATGIATPTQVQPNSVSTPSQQTTNGGIADLQRPLTKQEMGQSAAQQKQQPMTGIAALPSNQDSSPLMINGIPHQRLPEQKHPGPFSMMATGIGETVKFSASAPFSSRTDERLEANRAGLNTEAEIKAMNTAEKSQAQPQAPSPGITNTANAPINFSGIPNDQRFAAAEAYRTGIDKATGVSSTGAGGISGMKQRFDAYAKDDGILAMRNVREDLLGSGIKLEKNAGGGITITNGGNASNPLGAASGGNSINMAEGNKVMERANAITKSLIDAQPTGGIGILGDGGIQASNDEKTARWRQDEMINKMKYNPGLASLGSAVTASVNGENQRGIAEMNAGITTRGQDLQASNEAKRIAGSPEDKALKQAQAQGILAKTTDDKAIADLRAKAIAGDEKALATMRSMAGRDTPSYKAIHAAGGQDMNGKNPDQVFVIDERSGQARRITGGQQQGASGVAQKAAPASAIDYLKQNPAQADSFRAKYGYLPEGM